MTTANLLTEEQLAEIDTRARIATPPPWLVHHDPRKYVLMPFSSEEDVLRDRDANAAFCANAREDVPRLVAEVRRLRAELQPLQESDTYGWQPLMREIAKLSDALGLDDGDWSDADDSTLLEQFDPWAVIRSAIGRGQAGELAIIEAYFQRVCARAEATIARTHQVSGAHYAAMQVELNLLRQNGPEHE